MAWPMLDWVLAHRYADLGCRVTQSEYTVFDVPESVLIDFMEHFVTQHPLIRLSKRSLGTTTYSRAHRIG